MGSAVGGATDAHIWKEAASNPGYGIEFASLASWLHPLLLLPLLQVVEKWPKNMLSGLERLDGPDSELTQESGRGIEPGRWAVSRFSTSFQDRRKSRHSMQIIWYRPTIPRRQRKL